MIIYGEGNGTPLQYSCLENAVNGGAWWAAVHGVGKSRTQLSNFTFTFHFHALEKEMATLSSVLAWRILGMGEPGGLPSYGVTQSRTRLKRLSSLAAMIIYIRDQISRSVVSDSLRPHESQHTSPPCPSPTPRVHSDSYPLSQ